jgi:hypothetical protein
MFGRITTRHRGNPLSFEFFPWFTLIAFSALRYAVAIFTASPDRADCLVRRIKCRKHCSSSSFLAFNSSNKSEHITPSPPQVWFSSYFISFYCLCTPPSARGMCPKTLLFRFDAEVVDCFFELFDLLVAVVQRIVCGA